MRALAAVVLAFVTLFASSVAEAQRAASASTASPLPGASPESVGVSAERLARLTTVFKKEIEDKKVPGAVMMIARKGRLVYATALGARDPQSAGPMRSDTIFRIYSMTKPMVSVAAMILVENGTLELLDPVSKWLPAFKDMTVSTAGGDVPAQRAMTVQDLLRHTAGLPYGELTQNAAVKDALAKAGLYKPGVIDFDIRDMTSAEQVERLAKIPLIHQPGTTWEYSLASDVLGRVVEAAAGQRLGDFMGERLFRPLRMGDTAFWVVEAKMARVAEPFAKDPHPDIECLTRHQPLNEANHRRHTFHTSMMWSGFRLIWRSERTAPEGLRCRPLGEPPIMGMRANQLCAKCENFLTRRVGFASSQLSIKAYCAPLSTHGNASPRRLSWRTVIWICAPVNAKGALVFCTTDKGDGCG